MLEARNIRVPDRLEDCSLAITPGQVTAICGPNGAGKSTLLEVLAGLLVPAAGDMLLDDAALAWLSPRERARRIGYLPQNGEVAWNISTRTLAALGRLPHASGVAEKQRITQRALDAMGLADLAERPVSQLSGGEQARALLARVLAGEPQWILADEPLAALDLANQALLLRHFRALADEGRAVVLVLHDLAAAINHADRVILLDRGRVVQQGAGEEALSEEVIAKVWGVSARWLGEPGHRALAL